MFRPTLAYIFCLFGCVTSVAEAQQPPLPGDRYVAMGSSFAAGPGSGPPIAESRRCARSTANYPSLFAKQLGLALTDVSCSGAHSTHIVAPWNEIAAQIDSVTADTKLVTITIGGNDLGYIGSLIADACRKQNDSWNNGNACPPAPANPITGAELGQRLVATFTALRKKAPDARIIAVDYLSVLPNRGGCAGLGLSPQGMKSGRAAAKMLAIETARAARAAGIELLRMSRISREHDVCSPKPWMRGWFEIDGSRAQVPFHPNADGMQAVSRALLRHLARK